MQCLVGLSRAGVRGGRAPLAPRRTLPSTSVFPHRRLSLIGPNATAISSSPFSTLVHQHRSIISPLIQKKEFLRSQRRFCSSSSGDDEGSSPLVIVRNPTTASMNRSMITPPDKVLVVPMYHKPFLPGAMQFIQIQNQEYIQWLKELTAKHPNPYVGLFFAKNKQDGPLKDLKDVHHTGILAAVHAISEINNNGIPFVAFQGYYRINIDSLNESESDLKKGKVIANIKKMEDEPWDRNDREIKAYYAELLLAVKEIVQSDSGGFQRAKQWQLTNNHIDPTEPDQLPDLAAFISNDDPQKLQTLIETRSVKKRLEFALKMLREDLEMVKVQRRIHSTIEEKVAKNNREYFLREQKKLIEKELGITKDGKDEVVQKFKQKLEGKTVPESAMKVIDEEMSKFQTLETASSEYNVTRNYLDWLTGLPWGVFKEESLDVLSAEKVLNEDHFGLKDVKERILEFISVGNLKKGIQGKILCFIGPPGVGKTSIGKSIARSLNRDFYRFSVGGMSDTAEIKGHRRTYIGAMPGKLIQALKTVSTSNPVVMIDEIDKLGRGWQGDPASALLEVLDPEQNSSFLDHYLDVPYDLSKILFVCTANVKDTIPAPLLDRMEMITLSGYVMEEKMAIAQKHLIPVKRAEAGLTTKQVTINPTALRELIKNYCREAGVRNLQKQIEKVYRKVAFKIVKKESKSVQVTEKNLEDFVGKPVFNSDKFYAKTPAGVVMGLAWTSMGGATLYVEAVVDKLSSKPDLQVTGQLGDVMKESTSIAYTFCKSFIEEVAAGNRFFESSSLHMHIPEGATPKDGPSAGCTMVTALMSLALDKPVKQNLAMTGELTLTGKVLPIGGVKEKTIAARRSEVTTLIFPKDNKKDFDELEDYIKKGLTVHFVDTYLEVFNIAFEVEASVQKGSKVVKQASSASKKASGSTTIKKEKSKK